MEKFPCQNPPHAYKQVSDEKLSSGFDHSSVIIIDTPLLVWHASYYFLYTKLSTISTFWKQISYWVLHMMLKSLIFPIMTISFNEASSLFNQNFNNAFISSNLSGVISMVIFSVLNNTSTKILVDGGQALSSASSNPHFLNKLLKYYRQNLHSVLFLQMPNQLSNSKPKCLF